MTETQKIECVKAGDPSASDQKIAQWLHGPSGKKQTESEQLSLLEVSLRGSDNEWQLKTLSLIRQIPSGHLISYGDLARWINKESNLEIGPRNTAWLRKKIYQIIGHDTDIPIHRIAKKGKTDSTGDHHITININNYKREVEGSLRNPTWIEI